jgi:hypothetical protein
MLIVRGGRLGGLHLRMGASARASLLLRKLLRKLLHKLLRLRMTMRSRPLSLLLPRPG